MPSSYEFWPTGGPQGLLVVPDCFQTWYWPIWTSLDMLWVPTSCWGKSPPDRAKVHRKFLRYAIIAHFTAIFALVEISRKTIFSISLDRCLLWNFRSSELAWGPFGKFQKNFHENQKQIFFWHRPVFGHTNGQKKHCAPPEKIYAIFLWAGNFFSTLHDFLSWTL